MVIVRQVLTASNTDVLNGTDLESVPDTGVLRVYGASDQNDSTITITGPGQQPVVRGQAMIQRTNGMPDKNTDNPYLIGVERGGKYVIDITEVTAMVAVIEATWFDVVEVSMGLHLS